MPRVYRRKIVSSEFTVDYFRHVFAKTKVCTWKTCSLSSGVTILVLVTWQYSGNTTDGNTTDKFPFYKIVQLTKKSEQNFYACFDTCPR